jgi:hypothetical protein
MDQTKWSSQCEGVKHTKLMEDVKCAFEQSNHPLPKNLRKCLANLLQQHRGVIIKGERKGELPGLHPDKVRERNGSEKQKESKRKWNHSENGRSIKHKHNTSHAHHRWWHEKMVKPKIEEYTAKAKEHDISESVLSDNEAESIVQQIIASKKDLFQELELSDASVYFYYTAEPLVDPSLKCKYDGKYNPTEYSSFTRRNHQMPIVTWSPESKYYRHNSAQGQSHTVSKSQFDSLFEAKVVILWQGELQYNARKIEAKFQELYQKKWKPGKRLWKCPDYGQKFGDLLEWTQKWKNSDNMVHTAALVYSHVIPKFIESGDLVVNCSKFYK